MNPPAAAGGEETGAAGGGSGCRGAEGGGEAAGTAGIPEEQGLSAADESLEEKLRSLTFRKQVSYRSGVFMLKDEESWIEYCLSITADVCYSLNSERVVLLSSYPDSELE
ncbi:hypothetical protein TURU_024626 [Turdus rufiventris]|nr:hypothetical protein TURU_024626 [Turdus rufiventris]